MLLFLQATNTASLTTGAPTNSASATSTLNVEVAGCDVYTPNVQANPSKPPNPSAPPMGAEVVSESQPEVTEVSADTTPSNMRKSAPATYIAPGKGISSTQCVSSVSFWKGCMNNGRLDGRCAVVLKLPTGEHTAFFPVPSSKAMRTYKAVLTKPTNSGIKQTDLWFKAAQAVAATQLNELSGIKLPAAVRDALSLVGAAISTATSVPPVLGNELQGVPAAVTLLEKFSAGQGGVPTC